MKDRVRVSWLCCGVLLALSCRESMHPPAESVDTENTAPAKAETKAEPAPAAKAESDPPAAAKPHESTGETVGSSLQGNKEVTSDGYEVIRAKTRQGEGADVEVKAPSGWKVTEPPNSPDPHAGKFTLPEALKGLKGKGTLIANIVTSMGTFKCELYEDKAPITVANFVGLARGLRKFWSGADKAWIARNYYDGTTFHRVIPGFMIQGGDHVGDGTGAVFYTIPDELHSSLKHDRSGQLCMANRGPNTNEAQFFITDAAAPHLDSSYTIFGQCSPADLVYRIARVPQAGPPNNRPLTPVRINKVVIERGSLDAPSASSGNIPRNTVPGVVPPGGAKRVDAPDKPVQPQP